MRSDTVLGFGSNLGIDFTIYFLVAKFEVPCIVLARLH